jgi:hypothetical protein
MTNRGNNMSEKEEMTFGHQVTLMIVCAVLALGCIKFTFSLFEPYLQVACDTSQVPIDPVQP